MQQFLNPAVDLNGHSILITGGTGSFGKKFIRTVLERYKPARLIVYSRDELKQFEMAQELSPATHKCLRYFIGDVRDIARLEMAMRGIDTVVHAAALKHVPIAEYNPFECIATNVHGAENVVNAAIRAGVKQVVALSTDKAANPINLYGASKLASDKIFIAANHLAGAGGCRFGVVRYGNVIGSRGSVLPFFRKLIALGASELPITDERMTRFLITLQQGVNFVLSSMAMMRGGEIFVPKIPSMKIVDMASAIGPGLKQKVVGIRPGEKLHEVMITEEDSWSTVELADRYVIEPSHIQWDAHREGLPGAKAVAEGFYYNSRNNDDWMSAETLLDLLAQEQL
ncbi:UDP-N-acetylglucosamine 4,6-dehydratase (inverting) [Dongia soli]|uniref:UDP-N-acetylglucosamine 4,6-dehydratase (Inverting) n=1 Tax=Dongia soli TaxID=600628 RepID=A0ABU5EAV2_9PROT|nr:UDP-N-acetylglucosamine 4,6-dehydratase (inverting) [Dongia soli]MDY0883189.1 UDP-N-acetylglucosamine 4,6-dehydratase (inverting) [Dongia soli]